MAAGSAGLARSLNGDNKADFPPMVGLAAADGTAMMTKGSDIVWQRDEALAEVAAALFVDLPADAESADRVDAGHAKTGVMDHIQSQILNLKVGDNLLAS